MTTEILMVSEIWCFLWFSQKFIFYLRNFFLKIEILEFLFDDFEIFPRFTGVASNFNCSNPFVRDIKFYDFL